jgi:ketosteroid isomerase-like protein
MTKEELEIKEIVDRETRAWDTKDVSLLISIFHPDMVWPWPKTSTSHDPMEWELVLGKFNKEKWCKSWQELFDTYTLVHNYREIKKIVVSDEKDGAFAVVDIDTLWINKDNESNHWKGRVCKVYTRIHEAWKLIMHTGVLLY